MFLEIEYKLLTLAWPDKHSPPLAQNAPFSLACTRSIPLPSVPPSSWLRTSNTNGQSEQTRLCVLSPGFCVRRVFFALNHQLVRVSCCSGFPSYRLPTTQTRRWTQMSLARWRLLPRCCLTSVQSGMFLVSERRSKKPKNQKLATRRNGTCPASIIVLIEAYEAKPACGQRTFTVVCIQHT